MRKKPTIRLNESQFHNLVKKIVNESLLDFFKRKNKKRYDSYLTQYQIKPLHTRQELIDTCYLFADNFDSYTPEFFYKYILGTGLNENNSFIAIENNGGVAGACIATDEEFPFQELSKKDMKLAKQLYQMKYKCVSVLAVKPQYRGSKLNYELVTNVLDKFKQEGSDWAYIQVLHHLKTHDYWKRYGSVEVLDYNGVKHYALPISEKAKSILYKFSIAKQM